MPSKRACVKEACDSFSQPVMRALCLHMAVWLVLRLFASLLFKVGGFGPPPYPLPPPALWFYLLEALQASFLKKSMPEKRASRRKRA